MENNFDKTYFWVALIVIFLSIAIAIFCSIFCEPTVLTAHVTYNGELFNYEIHSYYVRERNVKLKLLDGTILYLQYDSFYICKNCHCFG